MNSRSLIDKYTLSDWVGANRWDESSLLNKYLQTGDLAFLLRLYKPYMHLVYGLAFNFVQDQKQSQEIVYCIFKKLIKEVKHQEIRLFSAWLYNLSLQFCKQWRQRGRSDIDKIVALGGKGQAPITYYDDDDAVFDQEISNMENEVKQLQAQQEKCVELFFEQQMCFEEISEITGWEVSQIKRHLKNVKRRANIYQE